MTFFILISYSKSSYLLLMSHIQQDHVIIQNQNHVKSSTKIN